MRALPMARNMQPMEVVARAPYLSRSAPAGNAAMLQVVEAMAKKAFRLERIHQYGESA